MRPRMSVKTKPVSFDSKVRIVEQIVEAVNRHDARRDKLEAIAGQRLAQQHLGGHYVLQGSADRFVDDDVIG